MVPTFLIVDGSSLFFRAFHAIPRLTTRAGFPTNAIRGFTSMLKKVLRNEKPEYAAVVFDAARKTFRNDLYPEYKAHRPAVPEELAVQIPWIKEVPRAYRIATLELADYEADDIIAVLARKAARRGMDVVVVTSDKDLLQIVTKESGKAGAPGVVLYEDRQGRRMGRAEVAEKYGLKPDQIPDLFGLTGDSSDNIPGVKGVGEKTAAKLLREFGTLEKLYEHLDRVPGAKLREKLERAKEEAFLSKRLATLSDDLPLEFDERRFRLREPDRPRLLELFRELEFNSELRELEGTVEPVPEKRAGVRILADAGSIRAFCAGLGGECAIEIVADEGDPLKILPVGLALLNEKGERVYIPASASIGDPVLPLEWKEIVRHLEPALRRKDLTWISSDIKFVLHVLDRGGATIEGRFFDTHLAGYLLQPDAPGHDLSRLASVWLGRSVPSREDLVGRGKKRTAVRDLPVHALARWACDRAAAAQALKESLQRQLDEWGALRLYETIELPLVPVLVSIEARGVLIDAERLRELSREFEKRMEALRREAYQLAGKEFNLDSPKQLREVLFKHLKLPAGRRTKTGYSTDARVLEELSKKHPLPGKILQYRTLAKLKSTSLDPLPRLAGPDHRVHTQFHQAVAATGRLSSSHPNLQNIPVRSEEGRLIRKAFVAREGCVLVGADYSQIELRILAHMSGDGKLVQAYRDGKDIHALTAAEVFDTPLEEVTPELRRRAKTINFGIIYGMSAHGLADRLDISVQEAHTYIEKYFKRYQGVRAFLDRTLEQARRTGWVETLFGRRRRVPDVNSRNPKERMAAERVAVNAPLQGTAADIIKIAMIRLHRRLRDEGFRAALILQVHDELIAEVPKEETDRVCSVMKGEMEGAAALRVPLKVDLSIGPNWADAKGG